MKSKKPKALFMIYLIIALTFSISLIVPNVKAQTKACCELTKSGEYCLYTDKYNCNPSYKMAETTCEQTAYCQVGCCFSEDTGYCYPNTPRSRCEALKGTWTSDPTCSISQCKKGCCMISDQCSFITQTMCKRETSKFPGVKMIFDDTITTEEECIDKCRSQEFGACVHADKSCEFTTRESCTETRQQGTKIGFHSGKLCSHPELETNCAKQQYTECYQGKVYWFDSCGNRENIYMSDKERSWNKGYILPEERTCTAKPDDKNCGNCDYSKGTVCGLAKNIKPTYGDYICRDINCKTTTLSKASLEATGGPKKHGESWCLYEFAPAFGMDVVGSRHLRASCINGEEIIEPCKDYREEFCIQTVAEGKPVNPELGSLFKLGEGFSEAMCIENRYEDCDSCNKLNDIKERQECCLDTKTKDCLWHNSYCSPHVPPGLKFWDESSKSVCSQADTVCKVRLEKPAVYGKYKCVRNCHCLTKEWLKEQNRRCIAQGDCGAWYNVEGDLTFEGFKKSGNWKGKPGILTENDIENWENIVNPSPEYKEHLKRGWYQYTVTGLGSAYTIAVFAVTAFSKQVLSFGLLTGRGFSFFGSKAILVGTIGAIAGWILVAWFLVELINTFAVKGKSRTITIKCNPWEPPDGGSKCELCNTGLAPCTEYRCKSLGKNCEIINEGTEHEKCININPYDNSAPIITPAQQTYPYTKLDYGYTIKQEIPPFTPITLAITTDEPAVCKFSLEQNIPYEDMEAVFGETFYDYNHTTTFSLPSELQQEEYLKITNGGKYTLYVKCKDKAGNSNKRDYYIKFQISKGPDFTPPKIELTSIENNALIPADKDKVELSIYLNEPSKCRWSNSDIDYTAMTNTFNCVDSGFDVSSIYYGLYECKTELPIEKQKTNNYFFRCKDSSPNENVNIESYPYTLLSTIPLKITSIKPTGIVYTANPVLEVTTSEGAENGIAFCGFSTKDEPLTNMIQFLETNSTIHKQQLSYLNSGIHTYYASCIDKAGNIAKTTTTFEIEADLTPPEIARIYKDLTQNFLVIELTEKSTCEYSFESFNYGSGIAMTGINEFIHKASLDPENNIYYVICQDEYQNQIDFKVVT